jgi:hypothetical protein
MDPEPAEPVIDYRGYWIELRLQGWCGTYRVRRPDGSWRYTQPTEAGLSRQEWVILGPVADGDPPELEVVASAEDARRRIDTLVAARDPQRP